MKFECRKCRYITEKDDPPNRCPYCGEPNTMIKAKEAQDIIDEVLSETKD
jgi:rubrerythrin